ncbi:MAG: sulfotransferase [Acidobacteriota bacterium]|nr:sulfotransferase [Acidobacteriota bacterium]
MNEVTFSTESAPGDEPLGCQPLVIIGAARSGTNILRDVLTALPGFSTWPCDEINPVWRHGNLTHGDDELQPFLATESVRRSIRRAFARQARRAKPVGGGGPVLVEKTCANSLRVEFVHRVLPEARFVFLVRDGRDVAASAEKRWTAEVDLAYSLRKARFVPPLDLPYYAYRFLANRVHRLLSGERRLAVWGPRFAGMEEAAREHTLTELCALQWRHSVERAEEGFETIDPARVFFLRYEDFTADATGSVLALLDHLGFEAPSEEGWEELVGRAAAPVRPSSVGNWRRQLDAETQGRLAPILGPTLERLGYGDLAEDAAEGEPAGGG